MNDERRRQLDELLAQGQITPEAHQSLTEGLDTPVQDAIPVDDIPVAEIVADSVSPRPAPPPVSSSGLAVPVIVFIAVAAVIGFIALPVLLLLPAVQAAREAARR